MYEGTCEFGVAVVVFADELVVIQEIELVPGRQLPSADHASEAVDVVDLVTGLAHEVTRCDALATTAAFGPEAPVGRTDTHMEQETIPQYLQESHHTSIVQLDKTQ